MVPGLKLGVWTKETPQSGGQPWILGQQRDAGEGSSDDIMWVEKS